MSFQDELRGNMKTKEDIAIENKVNELKIIWDAAQESISGLKRGLNRYVQWGYYNVIDGEAVVTASFYPAPKLLGADCVIRSYQDYNNGGSWIRVLTFTLHYSEYWNDYLNISRIITEKDNIKLSPYILYSKDEFDTDEEGEEGKDYKIYHESDFPITMVKHIEEYEAGPNMFIYYPDAEEGNFTLKIKATCEFSVQSDDDDTEKSVNPDSIKGIPTWDCPFCGCHVLEGVDVCPECGECSFDEYEYITKQIENIKKGFAS